MRIYTTCIGTQFLNLGTVRNRVAEVCPGNVSIIKERSLIGMQPVAEKSS
ncbi:MAG TPA: hypothetical protein V6C91_23170 [Coleofasciculaceae cyanobacterium]